MFSIPIYIVDVEYKVHFPDKATKDKYIDAERYYCKEEYKTFYRAISKEERFTAKHDLSRKKLTFAKQQNYWARTKGMPHDLYFNDRSIEKELA